MTSTLRYLVVAALALLVPTRPAEGSELAAMALEQLAANADAVFVGTVDGLTPRLMAPGSRYVVTEVTLRSERNLLGVPEGSQFVVRQLGGEVGHVGLRVYGDARYAVGERVLVFAARRDGSYYTLGMAQGALHVYRDGAGVSRVEVRLDGATLLRPAGVADIHGRALEEVVARVRSVVAARREPRGPGNGRTQ